MTDVADVSERIRAMLVDELVVEPSEVTPQARFFHDLGGESIDLLGLQFRIEKELGRRVDFDKVFAGGNLAIEPSGAVAAESLTRLREAYPFLVTDDLPPHPTPEDLKRLITLDAIVQLVLRSTQVREPAASPAPVPANGATPAPQPG